MCRFALYLGPPVALGTLLTQPIHSLASQAHECRLGRERENGDGCGAAWYVPGGIDTPMRFRDPHTAWGSEVWSRLGSAHRSGCVLAHVRAATSGTGTGIEECHPFVWETLAFMHNGSLPRLRRYVPALRRSLSRRARSQVRGTTDTALVFALFTDLWLGLDAYEGGDRLARALQTTVATLEALRRHLRIDEPAFLNLAVADGRAAAACRHASPGPQAPHTLFLDARRGVGDEARVMLASEPLDDGPTWQEVPAGHLVQVDAPDRVAVRPLEVGRDARAA